MKKIAVYGGSFDPPHKGHVLLANSLGDFCGAQKILVVPTSMSPFKNSSGASEQDRLEMCRLAFCDSRFQVLDLEIARGGKSYTIDTMREIKSLYPESELLLFMGDDMLLSFNKWYKYKEIAELCTIVAACRTETLSELEKMRNFVASELSDVKVLLCECVPVEVSSTEIRNELKSGESKFLSSEVNNYISKKGLYK